MGSQTREMYSHLYMQTNETRNAIIHYRLEAKATPLA
jgi:hypothetical protein